MKTRRRMSKADKGAEEEGMGRRRRRRKKSRQRRRRVREMRPPGRVGTLSLLRCLPASSAQLSGGLPPSL